MTIEDDTGPRRRRRTALSIAVVTTSVVVAAAVLTAVAVSRAAPGTSAAPSGPPLATVAVRRGDLSQTSTFSGTLAYGGALPLRGAGDGIITALPTTGTAVRRGTVLYRVDDQPVVVFIGSTPLFRTLPALPPPPAGAARTAAGPSAGAVAGAAATGPSAPVQEGITGTDVTVVAANLTALGFPPRRGCGVRPEPARGTRWTACLSRALARWQRAVGRPATGALSVGEVVVLPAPARVGAVLARPGDRASGDLLSLTAQTKVVSVDVQPPEAGLFRSGGKVPLTRPDGRAVPGTVTAVSRVVTEAAAPGGEGRGNGTPSLTVTVTPDRTADVSDLDYAAVDVAVVQLARRGVLTVPVAALLAVKGGGYALQRPDGTLVAATVGMVTDDMAEVSGPGVADGMTVVAAS